MAQDIQRRRDDARVPTPAGEATRLQLIETAGFPDYALLDSGAGRKLERFGSIVVDRPEPQALWTPAAPEREWRSRSRQTGSAEWPLLYSMNRQTTPRRPRRRPRRSSAC